MLRRTSLTKHAWRVHRNPTALPSLPVDGESPPNRFDDPQREYRVRYWATNKRGAFIECLARFRSNDETQYRLRSRTGVDEKAEPRTRPGIVPVAFLRNIKEVKARVSDPKHEFVDVAAPETHTELNKHPRVRRALRDSGLGAKGSSVDLDEATIRLPGPRGRRISQAVSRVVFEETEASGLHYTSRLDTTESCWAVFDWVKTKFSEPKPIDPSDPDLRSAALTLGVDLPGKAP